MNQDITGTLIAWREGDEQAPARLFTLVYDELRRVAHRQLWTCVQQAVGRLAAAGVIRPADAGRLVSSALRAFLQGEGRPGA